MAKTKQAKILAFGNKKILQAEQRFKASREKHQIEKLNQQKELLEYWFANEYPEITLKVFLVLSRKMEELEVRKELKYYKNDGQFSVIALSDVVDSHTWYNPYLFEKYVDSFVEIHQNSIKNIIDRVLKGITE